VGRVLTEKTIGFSGFFLNLGGKFTVSGVFGYSEFFRIQRCRLTCPIVLKNLIGLSAKGRPGTGVSNDFIPAPIILVKKNDLHINGSELWGWLGQFDLPVFILSFEYLHQKKFYTIASGSSISRIKLIKVRFSSSHLPSAASETRMNDQS
jgi:hypothetical protein